MANNAWQDFLSGMTRDQLLAALILRTAYVLGTSEDTQTIDLQTSLMLAKAGDFFLYDPADTTTAHDNTTCLVDSNGRRYKITDELQWPSSVLDRTGTPPGSPSNGDTYLVTAGATGAWASHDDDVAIYSATGWKFVAPRVGKSLYVEDETAFYHHDVAGDWTGGLGSLSLLASSVTPVESQFWGLVAVEDVLNTPPGSPANGLVWLVGTSPTGAFVGRNNALAIRRSGAWEFVSPYAGARIWDKDTARYLTYESSAWAADADFSAVETAINEVSSSTATIEFLDLGDFTEIVLTAVGIDSGAGTTTIVEVSGDNGSSWGSTGVSVDAGSMVIRLSGLNKAIKTSAVFTSSAGVEFGTSATEQIENAVRLRRSSASYTAGKVLIQKYRG